MHTEAEYARLAEALAEAQKLVQILGGQRDDNLIASANANARADAAEAWLKLRDMELEVLRPRLIAAEAQVAALVEALRECSSYPCVCDPGPMDDGVCPSCSAKAWFADFSDLAPAAAKHDADVLARALRVDVLTAEIDRHWLRLELPMAACTCGEWRINALDPETATDIGDIEPPAVLPVFSAHVAAALREKLLGVGA